MPWFITWKIVQNKRISENEMNVAEMRILRQISGNIVRDGGKKE